MSNRFAPGCRCCGCYRTMIVMCIYDESSPVYTSGDQYRDDLIEWTEFIDDIKRSRIRVGLLIPQGLESGLKREHLPWPKDTDRDQVLRQVIPSRPSPPVRITAQEIVDFFELIRAPLHPGNLNSKPLGRNRGPDLLLFCLDNSGSILTSQYAAQLSAAKAILQLEYPKMDILDDVSNAGERWVRDAFVGAEDRTCG